MAHSSLYSFLFLLLVLAGVVFRVLFWPRLRRERIGRQPFPQAWLEIVRRRLPYYDRLPDPLRLQLQELIKRFLHDKRFVGCAGQRIDDEIRVTVAAQACLLLLNRPTGEYPGLQSILIYPSTFLVSHEVEDELGLVSTEAEELLGESWQQGKVVLAWDSVEFGIQDQRDGHNVVLHEFAHQLDHETGFTNGAPLLDSAGDYRNWASVMGREFETLQEQAWHGQDSLLDHYGATDPAEFFAVATETFFECPLEMRARHRELYEQLTRLYRVDPAAWLAEPATLQ